MSDKNKNRNHPTDDRPSQQPGERSNKGTTQQDEQVNNPRKKNDDTGNRHQQQEGTDSDRRQGQRNGGE